MPDWHQAAAEGYIKNGFDMYQTPSNKDTEDTMQAVYLPYVPQAGGLLPMYVGSRRYNQAGAGLGDILRSAFGWFGRNVAPVLFRGGKEFLTQAVRAHESGASIKEAAKAALEPALKAGVDETINQIKKRQSGSGARKRARKKASTSSGPRPTKRRRKMAKRHRKAPQSGAGRRRRRGPRRKTAGRRRVYKAKRMPAFLKRPRLLTFRNF